MSAKISTIIHFIVYTPRMPVLWLIKAYQKVLSPDHSWLKQYFRHGYCKFYPTCSQYGYSVIEKKGLLRGVPLAIWRVIRCNPWSDGGMDYPV